jgi:hypothetical protein
MSGIDWMDTRLDDFFSVTEWEDGKTVATHRYPFGDGEAQQLMVTLCAAVDEGYAKLLEGDEDAWRRCEVEGEVPVIREGQKAYEPLEALTLRDLPAILDTFVVLEEEYQQREREESERKAAERKDRERVRAKERRKLKRLGEW